MSDRSRASTAGPGGCGCKVGRTSDAYGLAAIDDELVTRWTATGDDRSSLRELERYFNRQVLRAAMERAGMDPLDGEVEYIYRVVTDEDATGRTRVRARRRLEREGIDADDLRGDFVSHPTIGSHLKDCLGAEPPAGDGRDPVEKAEERIFKIQNRSEAVIRGSLEHLRDTDRLDVDGLGVVVTAQVVCDRCGSQYDVADFLRRGGCRCERE